MGGSAYCLVLECYVYYSQGPCWQFVFKKKRVNGWYNIMYTFGRVMYPVFTRILCESYRSDSGLVVVFV